jgi:hypothetical protein
VELLIEDGDDTAEHRVAMPVHLRESVASPNRRLLPQAQP